jgi:hypothetical protein
MFSPKYSSVRGRTPGAVQEEKDEIFSLSFHLLQDL